MTEIITNTGDLREFLEKQESLGVKNLEIDISGAIQGSFANCNISVDLDLFNEGIIEYI